MTRGRDVEQAVLGGAIQLQVDVGNTRLKWRLLSGRDVVARGCFVRSEYPDAADLLAALGEALGGAEVGSVLVSSVAASEVAEAIDEWAYRCFGVRPHFACVTAKAAGVEVGYDDPAILGVDRWLAVLAASAYEADGVVVVDCGSAVTVDVLCGRQHRGGYIVPGLRLMNDSLFKETARVQVLSEWLVSGVPGRNTAAAVNAGLPLMVAGLVAEVLVRQATENADIRDWKVLLTGGDASLLAPMLAERADVLVVEDLVFDGLLLAESRLL